MVGLLNAGAGERQELIHYSIARGADKFGAPKDAADRLRKNVPYKFKL